MWWGFDFLYEPYPDYPYYPYEPYPYEPYNPYAPYYGQPLYQQPAYVAPEIATDLDLHGAGTDGGVAAGVSVVVESRRFGFHAAVDGFYRDNLYGSQFFHASGTLGVASLHGTFSILSADAYRLRLEAGGSLLSWPDTFVSAGAVSVGPDVGISGRFRLAGPLGIVAHGRYTPAPVAAVDALGALALQFGNFAVTGGWRQLSVDRHNEVPPVNFGGPQVGLTLLF